MTVRIDRPPSPFLFPPDSWKNGLIVYNPTTLCVAVTGHRPKQLGCGYSSRDSNRLCQMIKAGIRYELLRLNPSFAISGMALGVDQWFAEVVLELRIPLIAAIPCDNQDAIWPVESQRIYQRLLEAAAGVFTICPGAYSARKMLRRDEWMVDTCNVLLAVWNGNTHGGTYHTVEYASNIGRSTVRIDPTML